MDHFWQAVARRDKTWDGRFVYGVTSTGIYCRPSCPSRRPKRDNAVFFAVGEHAQKAGYRACLRCRPDECAQDRPELKLVRDTCRLLEAADETMPTLQQLGEALQISPSSLQKRFSAVLGLSPKQYGDYLRLRRLKKGLRGGAPVDGAIYDAGYGSTSRVYGQGEGLLGMTPASYGKGGKGAEVTYAAAGCALGRLMIGWTAKGICFLALGDQDADLLVQLKEKLPLAELSAATDSPYRFIVQQYLEDGVSALDLPLDIRATAFQARVWNALKAIPAGETRSYSQVAQQVGAPKAVRAVGSACGRNPVALIIPCHRVLRGDGTLGGYAWGLERKQKLLEKEKEPAVIEVAGKDGC